MYKYLWFSVHQLHTHEIFHTKYFTCISICYSSYFLASYHYPYLIGLSVGFEQRTHIVNEGDFEELCLMFQGPLKNDSFVELSMSIVEDTADSMFVHMS